MPNSAYKRANPTCLLFSQALLQSMDRELCMRDRGLWVVNASGLVKADFFGKSDPYAKVSGA